MVVLFIKKYLLILFCFFLIKQIRRNKEYILMLKKLSVFLFLCCRHINRKTKHNYRLVQFFYFYVIILFNKYVYFKYRTNIFLSWYKIIKFFFNHVFLMILKLQIMLYAFMLCACMYVCFIMVMTYINFQLINNTIHMYL